MHGPLLVFGGSGLVGGAIMAEAVRRDVAVVGAARTPDPRISELCDLSNAAQVGALIERTRPATVVIAAALTNLDLCEAEPERSLRQNVETTRNVIAAAAANGHPRLVFLSTDHIFDGTQDAYVESDAPCPPSAYARHKRMSEELILAYGDSTIARTAWVFGAERRRKNFVYQVVDTARRGGVLRVPAAEGGCPTAASWLACTLFEMGHMPGIVHLTGPDLFTKRAWAEEIAGVFGLPLTVEERSPAELERIAPRPTVKLRSERHAFVQPPAGTVLASEKARILAAYEDQVRA